MAGKTGNQKLIEQLIADGMTYMFGNPGTVEQGFLDALRDYPEMRYILTLQESVAILMADGYARATKRPALAQIHSTPGLGNALGAMYQAMRGNAPLVVIGGDAGLRYMNLEAQMHGDLVSMARPVTKWSTLVVDAGSLLRTMRRAVKIASTPPMGPVYVGLPADVLDAFNDEDVFPACRIIPPGAPPTRTIADIAKKLVAAKNPRFFIGDGIAYGKAQGEITALAELLGAPVWGVDSGELNMDTTHICYQGQTGHMFGTTSTPITRDCDLVFIAGTYMLPEVYPNIKEIYHRDATIIHIDSNPESIAKNHRVDIGVTTDIKAALQHVLKACKKIMLPADSVPCTRRLNALQKSKKVPDFSGRSPVYGAFLEALSKQAPHAILFDEALTGSDMLNHYLPPTTPERFFQTRGGSLGVGIPGAMGIKLAFPEEKVIAFTGDGGSMYTLQALWTAARYRIGAKFVIINNREYGLLKNNIQQYWNTHGITPHAYPEGFSLTDPNLDFVSLARGQGVEGVSAATPARAEAAVAAMLATDKPFLTELII